LSRGYKENLVNRACREPFGLEPLGLELEAERLRAERPLGRTINPVKKVPPQAAKFIASAAITPLKLVCLHSKVGLYR